MYRKTALSIGETYHLYNRGVEKRQIFIDTQDYERFLKLLFFCNSENKVELRDLSDITFSDFLNERGKNIVNIEAFCLMPNHFHILIKEIEDGGISIFMKKILTAYSMYFNKKNNRSGALFGGTFKSSHAKSNEYLRYLFSYIHLNPAKLLDPEWKNNIKTNRENLYRFCEEYRYSSFQDYISNKNKRDISHILTKNQYIENSDNKNTINTDVIEWLNFDQSQG